VKRFGNGVLSRFSVFCVGYVRGGELKMTNILTLYMLSLLLSQESVLQDM
jgi:hypothetical protein